MFRTEHSGGLLNATTLTAIIAVGLWSAGLSMLPTATAAQLAYVSDTLSDSAPSAASNHTITFQAPSGVTAGQSITIDFGATGFNPAALDFNDIDVATSTDVALAASPSGGTWGVSTDTSTITITSGTGAIAPNATVTIEVGTNATFGAVGDTQIQNPASEGVYSYSLSAGDDSALVYVVLIPSVTVSSNVQTNFSFTVSGVGSGATVNGEPVTQTTSSTSIPFGTLEHATPVTAAQALEVRTNAANGYTVTMQIDGAFASGLGEDIDSFNNGVDTNTPILWQAPDGTLGSEATYGHWGFTTDDATTTRSAPQEFNLQEFAAASTTPRVVMSHDGPVNGRLQGVGTTSVGYKVEITALQAAGDDYTTTLTYIATPTF